MFKSFTVKFSSKLVPIIRDGHIIMDLHIYHSDSDNAPKNERFQISYSTKELTIAYFDG